MLESVPNPFDECKETLVKSESRSLSFSARLTCVRPADIQLDSGFKEFYKWAKANDIPVIIVSRRVSRPAPPRPRPRVLTAARPSAA